MGEGPWWGGEKGEGRSPPWLRAGTCWSGEWEFLGPKPGATAYSRRPVGWRTQPLLPGASSSHEKLAIEGARVLMPEGLARGPREMEVLSVHHRAGAANRSGHFETLSTMSPPFRIGRV